jgi:cyclohexanone monooxygenase
VSDKSASRSSRARIAAINYFDKNGDVPLRPTTTLEAYWRSRRFNFDDYRFTR